MSYDGVRKSRSMCDEQDRRTRTVRRSMSNDCARISSSMCDEVDRCRENIRTRYEHLRVREIGQARDEQTYTAPRAVWLSVQ